MRACVSAVLGIMIYGGLAGGAFAQSGATHSHGSGHGASPQGHLEAQQCASRFDEVVAQGLGFGLAFAADQNGYPGPIHVLELKDRLHLTPAQEAPVRSLYHVRTRAVLDEGQRAAYHQARWGAASR